MIRYYEDMFLAIIKVVGGTVAWAFGLNDYQVLPSDLT